MNKPEGQCIACGSLPDDEDRIECDFCCFGFDDFPPAHVRILAAAGEWALALLLTFTVSYFIAHIFFWGLRGWAVQ